MPINGSRHGPIDPKDIPGILWDFDKRLIELEKTVPNLISRIETNTEIMYELKDIVVKGNNEAMEFMRSVIGHEQNMDVVRQQLKQDVQRTELEMRKRAMEAEEEFRRQKETSERKRAAENEKWIREQKTENRAIVRQTVTKFVLIAAPILTALVTAIIKVLENWSW